MASKIFLSIVIPTRNQKESLKMTLQSIVPQMTEEVEVIVNDNSTNGETAALVQGMFQKRGIRYFKDEPGFGIDRYIIYGIERASGEYVWWMGDDEIEPGAVDHITKSLKAHPDISLIWVNYYIAGQNVPVFEWREDKFFEDRNHVLREIANSLAFASSIVLKKEALLDIDRQKVARFIGSDFINLYLVMHILARPGKFYYINHPYVRVHPTTLNDIKRNTVKIDGTIVNKGFQVHGVNFVEVLRSFRHSFNRLAVRRALSRNFSYLWRGMLVGWIGGWDTPKGKRWKMFKLYWSFPEFWIAMPLFLMPLWFNKILYRIYKIFFSHRKFIFIDNLKSFLNRHYF